MSNVVPSKVFAGLQHERAQQNLAAASMREAKLRTELKDLRRQFREAQLAIGKLEHELAEAQGEVRHYQDRERHLRRPARTGW